MGGQNGDMSAATAEEEEEEEGWGGSTERGGALVCEHELNDSLHQGHADMKTHRSEHTHTQIGASLPTKKKRCASYSIFHLFFHRVSLSDTRTHNLNTRAQTCKLLFKGTQSLRRTPTQQR